jgi:hypothetical protein
MLTPFVVNPQLSALALAYKNPEAGYIGDAVLPRVPKAQKFTYKVYGQDQFYTVPNTLLGRKAEPREVEFSSTAMTQSTEGYGLVDYVPEDDMRVFGAMPKAAGVMDPKQVAVMGLTNLMMLAREQRVASLVFNPATYLATQQQTLVGTAQWSDFANSDPALAILNAMDTMLVKPNKLVLGQLAFTRLRRHPKLVSAAFPISQLGNGSLTAMQLAETLGVNEVLVGGAYTNTSGLGLPTSLQRVWGKNAALIYSNKETSEADMPGFGFTAEFQSRQAQEFFEPKRGVNGVHGIKVVEQVRELVIANNCGYYFQNCIA